MPDNIDVTPGTGRTVATDDVGGIQYQKVKLDVGGDGVSAPLSTTDTLPATLYSSGTEVDFTAPVEVLGTGAAGTPATGVVTVQGIASGTNVPVSQATASALNATVVGAGAAGTANAGVVTVQGIASMTPVLVSQATAANLNATVVQTTATNLNAAIVGNVASDAADSGGPVKIGGIFRASGISSVGDGDRVDWSMSAQGSGRVVLAQPGSATGVVNAQGPVDATSLGNVFLFTQAMGLLYNGSTGDRVRSIASSFGTATGIQAIEQAGAPYVHLTASGLVKSGAGILHKIVVNTLSAGAITVYDNTAASGAVIAIINGGTERSIVYDLAFATGCYLGITGTPDVTVVYR